MSDTLKIVLERVVAADDDLARRGWRITRENGRVFIADIVDGPGAPLLVRLEDMPLFGADIAAVHAVTDELYDHMLGPPLPREGEDA